MLIWMASSKAYCSAARKQTSVRALLVSAIGHRIRAGVSNDEEMERIVRCCSSSSPTPSYKHQTPSDNMMKAMLACMHAFMYVTPSWHCSPSFAHAWSPPGRGEDQWSTLEAN